MPAQPVSAATLELRPVALPQPAYTLARFVQVMGGEATVSLQISLSHPLRRPAFALPSPPSLPLTMGRPDDPCRHFG